MKKVLRNYDNALKRAKKKGAVPKWADRKKIYEIYKSCPRGMRVDHIFPLNGELVSGLHVAENLQWLPRLEDNNKGNKFDPLIISRNEVE